MAKKFDIKQPYPKASALVVAECLKSYVCEDSLSRYIDGKIHPSQIKVHEKGSLYIVNRHCDKNYYKIISEEEIKKRKSVKKESVKKEPVKKEPNYNSDKIIKSMKDDIEKLKDYSEGWMNVELESLKIRLEKLKYI